MQHTEVQSDGIICSSGHVVNLPTIWQCGTGLLGAIVQSRHGFIERQNVVIRKGHREAECCDGKGEKLAALS